MSIEPALTAEEWAQPSTHKGMPAEDAAWSRHEIQDLWLIRFNDGSMRVHDVTSETGADVQAGRQRHALAALALHGQAFGFTREDVEALRDCVSDATETALSYDDETQARIRRAYNACDRIAALLPPTP